jgi:uncharacterized phage protein (TIGR01671 family)
MANDRFKFRAWHTDAKQMLYPERAASVFLWLEERQPVEIMQATGLKDRNGVEIFEGDIVVLTVASRPYPTASDEEMIYAYHTTKVYFESAAFWLSGDGIAECRHWFYNASDREIIGNIYEHPELLQEGE